MSFTWGEYFNLAQQLAGDNVTVHEDAKLRSAISRAYYAAYNITRRIARTDGYQEPGMDPHQALISFCNKASDNRWRRVGFHLTRLRIERNDADYGFVSGNIAHRTTLALETARTIIDLARDIRP